MNSIIIRQLAKSNRYQFLFNSMKEMNGIKLFKNKYDLSNIQVSFLQWLQIYSMLYTDLKMKEQYITEEVINDNLRTDAYLLYKIKVKDNRYNDKKKNTKQTARIAQHSNIPSVIFKRGK